MGLAHAAVQEDSLLQLPAGVGKQLCPMVSHKYFSCGEGGGGVGTGGAAWQCGGINGGSMFGF